MGVLFLFLLINTLVSFLVAELGKSRRIGYTNLLIISLLFGFYIGLFVALISPVEETNYVPDISEITLDGGTSEEREEMIKRLCQLEQAYAAGIFDHIEYLEQREELQREWKTIVKGQ